MTSNAGLFPCCKCPEVEPSCEVIPQGYVQGTKAFEEVFKATGVSVYHDTSDPNIQPCSYVFEDHGILEVKLEKTEYKDDNVGITLLSAHFETPPSFNIENNYLEQANSELAYPYTATSSAKVTHIFKFGSHVLKHTQTLNYVRDTQNTNIINRSDIKFRTTLDGSLKYCNSFGTIYFIKKSNRTEIYLDNVPIQHVAGTNTVITYKIEVTLTGYRGKGEFITNYFSWWKPDKWWLFPENQLSYKRKENYTEKELAEIKRIKEEGEKERQGCNYPTRCEDIFLGINDKYRLKLKHLPKFDLSGIIIDLDKVPYSSHDIPYLVSSNKEGKVYKATGLDSNYVPYETYRLVGPSYATISPNITFCFLKPYAPNICISLQYGKSVSLTGFIRRAYPVIHGTGFDTVMIEHNYDWFKNFNINLPENIGISKAEEEDQETRNNYKVTFTADDFDPLNENSSKSLFYIPYTLTTWFNTILTGVIRIKLVGSSVLGDTGKTLDIWEDIPTTPLDDYCIVNKADVPMWTESTLPGSDHAYAPSIKEHIKLYNKYCYVSTLSLEFNLFIQLFNEIHKRNITENDLFYRNNKYKPIASIGTMSGSFPVYTEGEPFEYERIDDYTILDDIVGELIPYNKKYLKRITIKYKIEGEIYYRTDTSTVVQDKSTCNITYDKVTPPADVAAEIDSLNCLPESEEGIVILDYPENECNFSDTPPTFSSGAITTKDNARTINLYAVGTDIIAEYTDNFNQNPRHQHIITKGMSLLISGCSIVRETEECQNGNSISRLTYYYDDRGMESTITDNPDPNKYPFSSWKGYDTVYKVTITDIKYE